MTKEAAEQALYAAEAGFNRARARMTSGGSTNTSCTDGDADPTNDPPNCLAALDGRSDIIVVGTTQVGIYTLQVSEDSANPGTYIVISTGRAGSGNYAATRKVSGTIKLNAGKVDTVYDS